MEQMMETPINDALIRQATVVVVVYVTATPRGRVHVTLSEPYAPVPTMAVCGFRPRHGWRIEQDTQPLHLSPCYRCQERSRGVTDILDRMGLR